MVITDSENGRLRVVALADSLAMPRGPEEPILWEHTWPFLLEEELQAAGVDAKVINCAVRARTADMLLRDFKEDILFKRPDVVVIQVGLVDGAPRIFSRFEQIIIQYPLRPFARLIYKYRAARRAKITFKNPLKKVYTSPKAFAKYLGEFHQRVRQLDWPLRVIVLPTLFNAEFMERKSPGYCSNMHLFNGILRDSCKQTGWTFIEREAVLPSLNADRLFYSDGYHLNQTGGKAMAKAVCEVLLKQMLPPVLLNTKSTI